MGSVYLTNEHEAYDYIDGFTGDAEEQIIETFEYAGEFFKGHARDNKRFNDITVNLKASIGYSVAVNGQVTKEDTTGETAVGSTEAKKSLKAILRENRNGIVLVGVAGMHYGMYVENMKGKSVLSQSIEPTHRLLTDLLDEL